MPEATFDVQKESDDQEGKAAAKKMAAA